jgi:hypothetical protein
MMSRGLRWEGEGMKMFRYGGHATKMVGTLLLHHEKMISQLDTFHDSVWAKAVPNIIPPVCPASNEVKLGTDFSSVKDTDWEKVRLQRELATLNEKIESAEAEARSRRLGRGNSPSSKSALVKRELEQMLDFKRRQLRRLKDGEHIETGGNLERIRSEIQGFKEQIDALAGHLSRREEQLKNLQRSIESI